MQDVLQYAYTREEEEAVTRAIEARFGRIARTLRERAPAGAGLRVDLCVIPAGAGATIVTRGMSAGEMRVPGELRGQGLERAELCVTLPRTWEFRSGEGRWRWPLQWLRLLARLPAEEDTWLGWGHTVPNGAPFADNTRLSSILLLDDASPAAVNPCFYRLVPLYEEELQFKLEHGTQALWSAPRAICPRHWI